MKLGCLPAILQPQGNNNPFRYMANKSKAQQSAAIEPTKQTVSVVVPIGESSETKLHAITDGNFAQFIGAVLKDVETKAEFSYLGKRYVIPSLTANNSNPERAGTMFKQLVANCFNAENDRITVIDEQSKEGQALMSLKAAGFKFQSLCKVEVLEAVQVWLKNKRAKLNLHKEAVRKLNAEMIAETKVINGVVKEMRKENLQLITGFETKAVKNHRLLAQS